MSESLLSMLKTMYGPDASFRDGQQEAIEIVISGKRALVVQRTGWGKSTVYFIATKVLRDKGYGPTILISPLLSLMRNQIESANKLGVKALAIHSGNDDEWDSVKDDIRNDQCDLLLISPERLGNYTFINEVLPTLQGGIGMFVVDEAHCISDWGHDFRPDYKRIVNIVRALPTTVPLLATTATANDRVVEDVQHQLGDSLHILRGPLGRESLKLQVIELKSQSERLAWLLRALNDIEGSGIIYCLTIADCERVARWLQLNGVNALSYHGQVGADTDNSNEERTRREQLLLNNQVKALVSTIALGMGYDKPDLSFVIHYQRPGSLVSYYQQIGRAGRALDTAQVVLLCGAEDDEIQEFFITSAFPTSRAVAMVLEQIENAENGLTRDELLQRMNCSLGTLEKCLKVLTIEQALSKEKSRYYRTPVAWILSTELSDKVTAMRRSELKEMKAFTMTDECYMEFISKSLDDPYAEPCGKCTNCTGKAAFEYALKPTEIQKAEQYLKHDSLNIQIKKRWPANIVSLGQKNIPLAERVDGGQILSVYGDAGWGRIVKLGKYQDRRFSDELVEASYELIAGWGNGDSFDCITYVPSLKHPELVPDFARRLADRMGIPCVDAIVKTMDTQPQKSFENSFQQCRNAYNSFRIAEQVAGKNVLLVDDMVDSGWTITVCGFLLKQAEAASVYAYALASSSKAGE